MKSIECFLEKLAITTWDTIGNAYEKRISYGEDAITSVNLLALKNASFRNLAIEDTRINENVKGCDFEFWIGNYLNGWHRYAIQAKKITVSDDRYSTLDHKVGGTPQIDILEKYSFSNKAFPLYCLFNYSKRPSLHTMHCPQLKEIKELGCSVTPLSTVKIALATRGARTFSWFHNRPETVPWSCLVRCPQLSSHWPDELVGHHYHEKLHEKLPDYLTQLLRGESEPTEIINSNIFSRETPYRPRWVGVIDTSQNRNNG